MEPINQQEKNSRFTRFIKNRFTRITVLILVVAVVAVGAYIGLGLVNGGVATLSMVSSSQKYFAGDRFSVDVYLNSSGQPVTAVGSYIQYDPQWLVFEEAKIGSGWTNVSPTLIVNETVISNTVYELEIVAGQPHPGISSSSGSPRLVATLFFQVAKNLPLPAGSTLVRFNESKSVVVKDDPGGVDILGSVAPSGGLSLDLFTVSQGDSCTVRYPTARVCDLKKQYCPTPFSTTDLSCCKVDCKDLGSSVRIFEDSITPEIIRNPVDGTIASVAILWQTDIPSDSEVIDFAFTNSQGVRTQLPAQPKVAELVTSHRVALALGSWDPSGLYHFKVRSTNNASNCSAGASALLCPTSGEQSFSVSLVQSDRVQILDLAAKPLSNTTAVITWTTKLATNSSVTCTGATGCFGPSSSAGYVTFHSVTLRGLTPNTTYQFNVRSELAAGDHPDITGILRSAVASGAVTTSNLLVQDDANIILKVQRDRTCDRWLSCTSSLKIINKDKKIEDMCFSLGECSALNPANGECVRVQSKEPLSLFTSVSGNAFASTIDEAKNLSGYSQASLRLDGFGNVQDGWLGADQSKIISGYSSLASLRQSGSSVALVNGTFDRGTGVFPWITEPRDAAKLEPVFDTDVGGNVLKISPSTSGIASPNWGAKLSLGKDPVAIGVPYYVSFQAKAVLDTESNKSFAHIKVQLGYKGYTVKNVQNSTFDPSIGEGWQQFVIGPFIPPSNIGDLGEVFLGFLVTSDIPVSERPVVFYIDSVIIQPVLGADSELQFPQVCRAYPSSNAPTCDFFDPFSGKIFRGWRGYCLLPDPKNISGSDCLQWWPGDIVSGSASSFQSDTQAGYIANKGRFPLYYCTEAEGNGPYIHKVKRGDPSGCLGQLFGNDKAQGGLAKCVVKRSESKLYSSFGLKVYFEEMSDYMKDVLTTVDQDSIFYADVTFEYNEEGNDNFFFQTVRLAPQNDWTGYWNNGGANCPKKPTWSELESYLSSGTHFGGGNCDLAAIHFEFDPVLNTLTRVKYGYLDDTDKGAAMRVWDISLYAREACSVVTQVVDPFGRNAAQTKVVSSKSEQVPLLAYGYSSDYQPFGAVVHPDPDYDPEGVDAIGTNHWGKLFIESPSVDQFSDGPFQARAGQPYGVSLKPTQATYGGYCYNKPSVSCSSPDDPVCSDAGDPQICYEHFEVACSGGLPCHCKNTTFACTNDSSCGGASCVEDFNPGPPCDPVFSEACLCGDGLTSCRQAADCSSTVPSNFCVIPSSVTRSVGPSICILGSELGVECQTNADCGSTDDGGDGYCAGPQKPSDVASWNVYNTLLSGSPAKSLSSLFAKTYGTWQWVGHRYEKICGEAGVPICVGGVNDGLACGSGADCGTGGSCGYQMLRCGGANDGGPCFRDSECTGNALCLPVGMNACANGQGVDPKTYGWDATAGNRFGIIAKAPTVKNIKINSNPTPSSAQLSGFGNYSADLSFTSHVDPDQLPLVRYTIDWGDGEITSEGDLSIDSKRSETNPHRLGHVYRYFDPATPYPFGCKKDVNCVGTYASRCSATQCQYQIKIQIQDNWGWCNGGTNGVYQCGLNSANAWTNFPYTITVKKP